MLVNMKADFKTGLKICSRCKRELPLSCFSKSKGRSDGLEYNCKECLSVLIKLYRNTERRNQKMKEYNNSDKGKLAHQKYYKSGGRLKYLKQRYQKDPQYRIEQLIRSRFLQLRKGKKQGRILELLGCSWEFFLKHIESQFQEGMTWENQGRNGWELDHIIPCSYFDQTDLEQQRICWNYRNFQPLWEKDNLLKRANLPDNIDQIIQKIKSGIKQ